MVTTIAFYLPQYHPIAENDEWWGPGFTEWVNVGKARPGFRGHYQPHIPGELGYYDLRLEETRAAQAALAQAYRVDAFSYYHYWFNGRQLLEKPFDEVLRLGRPDHRFVLNWANENWTRTWDGEERSVLIEHDPARYDADAHIEWLSRAFEDPRYLRVGDRPIWIVYTAANLRDPAETVHDWRVAAKKRGFPDLYICNVLGRHPLTLDASRAAGFDASIEFAPQFHAEHRSLRTKLALPVRAWNRAARALGHPAPQIPHLQVYDYPKVVDSALRREHAAGQTVHPCVSPGWDNAARRPTTGQVCQNDDPALYGRWVEHAVRRASAHPEDERLVFINAWNEWGEGCHLEPDRRHGRAWLEATRDAVERGERAAPAAR